MPLVGLGVGACGESYFAPYGDEDAAATTTDTGSEGDESGSSGEPEDPEPPLPEFDGEPLPEAPVGVWQWVDFPESRCRDGSSTGIGVRRGSSDNLVVFFEGGGACFNGFTCLANDENFGADEFADWQFNGYSGLFNPSHPDNPVADWSFVYVPYCTGDVHAGSNADIEIVDVPGVQQFAGYTNVERFLDRIVPTFGGAPHVLVTGVSAGGFGAGFNYSRMARVFTGRVTLIDDSGPGLRDEYLAPCLQQMWRDAWGLTETMPVGCRNCRPADGGSISELVRYIGEHHPRQRMGFISSERDRTISTFFGFGLNECEGLGAIYTSSHFRDGVYDFRDQVLEPTGNWGSYLIPGNDHTWIAHWEFYETEVDGVRLVDWVADLLDGEVSHVSPNVAGG